MRCVRLTKGWSHGAVLLCAASERVAAVSEQAAWDREMFA